eukprot:1306098-Amphidinium_carterae.1
MASTASPSRLVPESVHRPRIGQASGTSWTGSRALCSNRSTQCPMCHNADGDWFHMLWYCEHTHTHTVHSSRNATDSYLWSMKRRQLCGFGGSLYTARPRHFCTNYINT